MQVPVIYLIYGASALTAVPVFVHARRIGRRSPTFDALIAWALPLLGAFMYVSSVRMGLTPPPLGSADGPLEATGPNESPEVRAAALAARKRRESGVSSDPSPSLMSELTAEVKRLRAELEEAHAEITRLKGSPPD